MNKNDNDHLGLDTQSNRIELQDMGTQSRFTHTAEKLQNHMHGKESIFSDDQLNPEKNNSFIQRDSFFNQSTPLKVNENVENMTNSLKFSWPMWKEILQLFAIFAGIVLIIVFLVYLSGIFGSYKANESTIVKGTEEIMSPKANGSCVGVPQIDTKWKTKADTANKICCHNRKYQEVRSDWEHTGLQEQLVNIIEQERLTQGDFNYKPIKFYDIVTDKHLFTVPNGRSFYKFYEESRIHGWLSFRDAEVNWDNVRVIDKKEIVSIDGTHLGSNEPDENGNRFSINIACIAGDGDKNVNR